MALLKQYLKKNLLFVTKLILTIQTQELKQLIN